MCGIVGVVSSRGALDRELLLAMRDSFVYRGPDDAGDWVEEHGRAGFGHRRLSILDPTPAGHQPMIDPDTGNVIAFNGEVFNYIEIRAELERRGLRFTTGTDTEVILKAYAVYGEDCVDHFNGMFAIAIWDVARQTLFLARDRLGIKPLYYYQPDPETLCFASEVKALRIASQRLGKGALAVNDALIDHYMSFGYLPGEHTLEQGIERLLPGHRAHFDLASLDIEPFWDLSFNAEEDLGFDHYLEQGKALLNNAIDLRLRSDVPLGIFLSGGIDSSAVVGLLAERVSTPLKTFSVAYDFGEQFNETNYARQVSERFATEHHELMVQPEDFRQFIPSFADLMGEPVTESAAISLQLLSQMTKQHVTVVLSGEGSDEIFGGYDLYRYMATLERLRSVLGSGGSRLLNQMLGPLFARLPGPAGKVAKYLHLASLPLTERYRGISTYDERAKTGLYQPGFAQLVESQRDNATSRFLQSLFERTESADVLSRMLYFDTKTWLVDDLLIKADRMSMASSLELRVPFLDYRMVEFAASMPSHYKVQGGQGKFLLKKMMEGILPEGIIYRKKMGFPTPLKIMFQGELGDFARAALLDSSAALVDYFERDEITRLLDEHQSGRADYHRELWQLLVLEQWFVQRRGHG